MSIHIIDGRVDNYKRPEDYDGYEYDYKEVIGCDSVSKLQQALRLLNIDKEIISCGI